MPKSGIGEHAHRYMEEMYFVLDRYAEFTVNGITSEVPSVRHGSVPQRKLSRHLQSLRPSCRMDELGYLG